MTSWKPGGKSHRPGSAGVCTVHGREAPLRRLGVCRLASSPHHGRCLIRTEVRRPIGPPLLYFAAVFFCSICSNFASDLGGAKGIRTPDLLHAIWRQPVYPRPCVQVTVLLGPYATTSVRVRCGTSMLYLPTGQQYPAASQTARPSTSALQRSRHVSLPENPCSCHCAISLCRPGRLRPSLNRRASCAKSPTFALVSGRGPGRGPGRFPPSRRPSEATGLELRHARLTGCRWVL
jgi:hypothetical protein